MTSTCTVSTIGDGSGLVDVCCVFLLDGVDDFSRELSPPPSSGLGVAGISSICQMETFVSVPSSTEVKGEEGSMARVGGCWRDR
ncbi:hypothetical protein CEXT_456771 [Caerostris extrusa]|uniref:Uncharacterized protein n=1 Tax=Caerostris extrusa TaxID=172846 RepID=A0AAV4W6S9_CAEEX|nr:hypothetical protein CEXT_456771 [Caerostris extrusa]